MQCEESEDPLSVSHPRIHSEVDVGHRWDRVAMDLLDMSVTIAKGNRYVLVMVDCFYPMDGSVPVA